MKHSTYLTVSRQFATAMAFFVLLSISGQDIKYGVSLHKQNLDDSLDSLIALCLDEIQADSIENTVLQLQDMGTRFMMAPNRKEVAIWIKSRFESVGCSNTQIDSFQTHTIIQYPTFAFDSTTWQYNVIATLSGSVNPNLLTMIGGHYDCMTQDDPMNTAPGADDNGASVAAIIELARVLNNQNYQPNKTIQFVAFGAEELMNYSTQSGAGDLAEKCLENGDQVILYINNDMIAYETETSNWMYDLMIHDLEAWTSQLTVDLTGEYTSLEPNIVDIANWGADDLAFWEAGYKTVYFMEHGINPNYHSESDIVENCNFDYCKEIAKLNMALLITMTEQPCPVDHLSLNSLYDGQTLIAEWKSPEEIDILNYRVRFGIDPDNLELEYFTEETSIEFAGLETGLTYFAEVSAINSNGFESYPVIKHAKPAVVTLDQGILVVNGSSNGLLGETQEEIELFYDSIFHNYKFELFDATSAEEIYLGHIGSYSSIIWHTESHNVDLSVFAESIDVMDNYLDLGGNLMFTGFRPARVISDSEYPARFKEGSFMFDKFHISECNNEAARLFSGAMSQLAPWSDLYVDSVKMPAFNYHLPWVEAFTPAPDANVLYLYDTEYDPTTVQGAYFNLPVGITGNGEETNTFILGFPLYYMDYDQSKQLIYQVMTGLFGEEYLNTDEILYHENELISAIYPNPARDHVNFNYLSSAGKSIVLKILDSQGAIVEMIILANQTSGSKRFSWDTKTLPPGVYFYQATDGIEASSGKIIISASRAR